MQNKIQIFEKQPIRTVWEEEGSEVVSNTNQLKLSAMTAISPLNATSTLSIEANIKNS
jgi:hypothetical protein